MRIVAGRYKGKTLKAPMGRDIRPTSDRAREAVFNILVNGKPALELEGLKVLDLFSGSGALALEALSRGAVAATLVDHSALALKLARQNAGLCGCIGDVTFLKLDAGRLPPPPRTAHTPADLIFIDPPYGQGLILPTLLGIKAKTWAAPGAILVVEMAKDEEVDPPPGFTLIDVRTYGAAKVQFLNKSP